MRSDHGIQSGCGELYDKLCGWGMQYGVRPQSGYWRVIGGGGIEQEMTMVIEEDSSTEECTKDRATVKEGAQP